jgi:hypothetical protein
MRPTALPPCGRGRRHVTTRPALLKHAFRSLSIEGRSTNTAGSGSSPFVVPHSPHVGGPTSHAVGVAYRAHPCRSQTSSNKSHAALAACTGPKASSPLLRHFCGAAASHRRRRRRGVWQEQRPGDRGGTLHGAWLACCSFFCSCRLLQTTICRLRCCRRCKRWWRLAPGSTRRAPPCSAPTLPSRRRPAPMPWCSANPAGCGAPRWGRTRWVRRGW